MRFSAAMTFPMFHMAADEKPSPMTARPSAPATPSYQPPPQRQIPDEDDFDLARRVRESGEW